LCSIEQNTYGPQEESFNGDTCGRLPIYHPDTETWEVVGVLVEGNGYNQGYLDLVTLGSTHFHRLRNAVYFWVEKGYVNISESREVEYTGALWGKEKIESEAKPQDGYEFVAFIRLVGRYDIDCFRDIRCTIVREATHVWIESGSYYFFRRLNLSSPLQLSSSSPSHLVS